LLNRLFGRSPPSAEVEAALAELDQLSQERAALANPSAVLRNILPLVFERPARESAPILTPEQALAKLSSAIPLLRGEGLLPESKSFRRRWLKVCAAVESGEAAGAAQALGAAVKHGTLDPLELAGAVLAGHPEAVLARLDRLGLDAGVGATVLRLTLFPVLARVNTLLSPLREGVRWEQGYCPTCGSWPLLGEFRGLEQLRFLRCGLCAADWEFPRMRCPFCGTQDHEALGYFHVEGKEARLRAATCSACRGYIKMATTLAPLTAPQLLVKDLATMHLDLAAAARGYGPPL
jgi:FdhE protein